MKLIVVIIVALTLLATAILISSCPRCHSVDSNVDAEQFWAAALLSSLPFGDSDATSVHSNFSEALRRANRKAPILISIGDLGGSVSSLQRLSFNEFAENSPSIFVPKVEPDFVAERILQGLAKLNASSTAAYQAAVQDDPNCLVGWMRLTCAENETIARDAANELIRRESNNALCHYIHAAFEEDILKAFSRIEIGNHASLIQDYGPEFPTRFDLTVPSTPDFREFEIAGKPLSPVGLQNMIAVSQEPGRYFHIFVDKLLRKTVRKAFQHAESLLDDGRFDRAEDYLNILRHCGLRLISGRHQNQYLILLGINVLNQSCDDLNHLYVLTGEHSKAEMVIETLRQLEAYREALHIRSPSKEDMYQLFCGDVDYVTFSTAPYYKALRVSGLSESIATRAKLLSSDHK